MMAQGEMLPSLLVETGQEQTAHITQRHITERSNSNAGSDKWTEEDSSK